MWNIESSLANKNTPWIPLSLGRFYSSPNVNTLTTLTMATGTLYAIPFLMTEVHTATSINIEVTTQLTGTSARLGIYNDSNGAPSTLLLDAGLVALAGTGNKAISISQSMPAGWYWLALCAGGAAAVRALSQSSAMPMLGFSSGTDTTTHVGWSVAFNLAALPNPFQAGGSLMAGVAPRILLGI